MRPMLAVLFAAVLAIAADAHACSCIPPQPPDKEFAKATVVFEGKVVAVRDDYTFLRKASDTLLRPLGMGGGTYYGFTTTFEVTRVWRGSGARRVAISSGRGGGDCGYRFEKGKTYLVYGYCDATGKCGTGICTRTNEIGRAAADLQYLAAIPSVPLKK